MLRRIWALTQKESIQLLRMPIVYIGLTLGPMLELALFAAAIHTDVKHIPMVVADQSLSAASQQYLGAFTQSQYFDIVATVPDQQGIVHAIDTGAASIGVLIPNDFAARLEEKDANVLLLVDGSNSFVTQAAAADASAISQRYAISLTQRQVSGLDAHFQILYNPDLKDLWFLVPGMGAFLLYGIALLYGAVGTTVVPCAGWVGALVTCPPGGGGVPVEKTAPWVRKNLIQEGFVRMAGSTGATNPLGLPVRKSLFGLSRDSISVFNCQPGERRSAHWPAPQTQTKPSRRIRSTIPQSCRLRFFSSGF